jgi:simple sugar transport system ATP-binding protein
MREPRLLVLDEPTAVLLPAEIASLLAVCERVAAAGCGVLLVTHKLAEIQQVARRATVLRGGRLAARSEQPAAELDQLVRAMIERDLDSAADGEARAARPRRGATRPAPLLMVDGLGVKDAEGVVRLDNFTLLVEPGEIVAVAGVEGNGQSELAAVLSGMRPASEAASSWRTRR